MRCKGLPPRVRAVLRQVYTVPSLAVLEMLVERNPDESLVELEEMVRLSNLSSRSLFPNSLGRALKERLSVFTLFLCKNKILMRLQCNELLKTCVCVGTRGWACGDVYPFLSILLWVDGVCSLHFHERLALVI